MPFVCCTCPLVPRTDLPCLAMPHRSARSIKLSCVLRSVIDDTTIGLSAWQATDGPQGGAEDGSQEGVAKLEQFAAKAREGDNLHLKDGCTLSKDDPR